jgi:hypothetical protein
VADELDAWDRRPVFAYGFEDLTGAEWALLEGLAARSEVTVSLPYEPGRAAFASLERTAADLASLGRGRIEELPPGPTGWTQPGLAYIERALFEDTPPASPPLSGELRFFEGAGSRVTHELVGEEILGLLRAGVRAEEIAVVCPSIERGARAARDRLLDARDPVRGRGPGGGSPKRPSGRRSRRCSATSGWREAARTCTGSSAHRTRG